MYPGGDPDRIEEKVNQFRIGGKVNQLCLEGRGDPDRIRGKVDQSRIQEEISYV
jgi:hypothetical protein